MKYNFDEIVDRNGTNCVKYDGIKKIFPDANKDTIPMFVADMDLKTSQAIIDAVHRVADYGMWGYTTNNANDKYNNAIIRWFDKKHNTLINPEEIIYSNGTIEAINTIIKAFSNVGEGIILCRPVYGHFTECIEKDTHRKVVDCHLIKNSNGDYIFDYDAVEKACSDPTNRIFILSSPHNPVGRVWKVEELRKIAEICKKNDILLVSDEVHCDIVRKGIVHHPIISVVEDFSNIIMLTAINKTFNVAGLQCSNVIIRDRILRERFINQFGLRMPTPFAVEALIAAYTESDDWEQQVNEYIDDNIDFAIDFFRTKMPWVNVTRPEGTYCLWIDFSACGLTPEEVHKKIYIDANVLLQAGTVHDPIYGAYCHRMCLPVSRKVLQKALERIAAQF